MVGTWFREVYLYPLIVWMGFVQMLLYAILYHMISSRRASRLYRMDAQSLRISLGIRILHGARSLGTLFDGLSGLLLLAFIMCLRIISAIIGSLRKLRTFRKESQTDHPRRLFSPPSFLGLGVVRQFKPFDSYS